MFYYLAALLFFVFRGSVVAKIVGYNVLARPEKFVREVPMYVYEEVIDGRKLTEIINTQHENVKYLPGCILPDNVVGLCLLIALLSAKSSLVYLFAFYYLSNALAAVGYKISLSVCQSVSESVTRNELNALQIAILHRSSPNVPPR